MSETSTLKRVSMRTVSLRSIAAHKLRLFLTVLAVVLGTAFISGAFVFTASLNKAFDGALATAYDGVDVAISAPNDNPNALDKATVDKIAHHPDVANVNVSMNSNGIILTGHDGKVVQTTGAPAMGLVYYPTGTEVGSGLELTSGHAPNAPGEVVINSTAAKLGNLEPNDEITVVTSRSRAKVTVVGIAHSSADNTGWLSVLFSEDQWRELYTDGEHVDQLSVSAKPGTDVGAVTASLRSEFPGLKVEEGSVLAKQDSEKVSSALSFVNYFLIAFGLIGLLVGTFIISNTFSMLVAQRTNEFALLRSLGASRRQLTGAVLFEAAVVGLVGSAIGVAAGFGLTKLLYAVIKAFGMEMPGDGLTVTPQALFVPIAAGLLITLLAAWAPAARAGRIPPVEAMRSGDQSSSSLALRTVSGLVVGCLAAALLIWPALWTNAATGTRASLVGVGAVLAIIALWLASPAMAKPLVGGLGRIFGAPFGAVGKLAATNSQRNPRRTATTAFALMLGLALVTSVGMLGTTMKHAVDDWLQNDVNADYFLAPPMTAHVAMPRDVASTVQKVTGVKDTATMYMGEAMVLDPEKAAAVTPDAQSSRLGPQASSSSQQVSFFDGNIEHWYNAKMVEGNGDLAAEDAGVTVNKSTADENHWHIGSNVALVGKGTPLPARITGIFTDDSVPSQSFIVSPNAIAKGKGNVGALIPMLVYVQAPATDQQSADQIRQGLNDAVADYLVVQVMSAKEYGNIASGSIDVMLGIVYGLLGLAVIISVLGIINTLALSIVERRQEIGMLRSIGVQRSEIRRMIRLESLQIAVFGAVTGVLLGLALGWSLLTVLEKEGLGDVIVPWNQIAAMLVGSAIVGVLAALWPAHKAATTPPLAAIAED